MITTTYTYSSGTGFTYDSTKVAFASGHTLLKLVDHTAQSFVQDFADSAGFTYDPSLLEFVGGQLQQKSQLPAGAVFGAKWSSMLNASFGAGDLTGTPAGGAAINNGVLDLSGGGNKTLTYDATNNMSQLGLVGCVNFRFKPNYTGTPADNQVFFDLHNETDAGKNRITIFHATNGEFFLLMNDSDGNNQLSNSLAPYSADPNMEIEIELSWDFANQNKVRFFGDGFLVAEIDIVFFRSNDANHLQFGDTGSDFFERDFIAYDSVQHTANYTPFTYVVPEQQYVAAGAILPAFNYSGLGAVQAWESFADTATGALRFIIANKWWDGSAWSASDGTYGHASPASDVAAHIATLPLADTLIVKALFPDSSSQLSIADLTVGYTGQIYPTDNPTIRPSTPLSTDEVTDFVAVSASVGSDGVKFYLLLGAINYYWNGSAWVASDGSYAQSNTAAEVLAHLAALPIDLGAFLTPVALLHSADGSTTPTLTSTTITYQFFGARPAGPNICSVFGYVIDEQGVVMAGAKVTITNPTSYFNGGILQAQGAITVTTSSVGYFEIDLAETTTVNRMLTWTVQYPTGGGRPPVSNAFSIGKAKIPNTPEVNFSDLVFVS